MEVEDVAGVSLAARRTAQQEGDLAVSLGLLGEVVVDDERVLTVLHPVLAHRAARVRREVLERGRLGGRCRDDDGVLEGSVLGEGRDRLRDGRTLLTDGDVDALDPGAALVDDRVGRDRRLACLAVADDELTLATADGCHRVDDLDACLQWFENLLPRDDARCLDLETAVYGLAERAFPVDRLAKGVHDASQQRVADRHRQDPAGRADHLALVEAVHRSQHDRADRLLVEVEGEAYGPVLELEQLVDSSPGQACDPCDAVADLGDPADLLGLRPGGEVADIPRQRRGDLVGVDRELGHQWGSLSSSSFSGTVMFGSRQVSQGRRGRQRLAKLVEAVPDRAVDHGIPDLDGHPAQQRGLDLHANLDRTTRRAL